MVGYATPAMPIHHRGWRKAQCARIIHATVKYMNVREQYTIHSYYHVLQHFRTQVVTSTPEPATRRDTQT